MDKVLRILMTKNEEEIIETLDTLPKGTVLLIDASIQDTIMNHLKDSTKETDIWERLLLLLEPSLISDNVIEYLIKKKTLLTELCHMELPDHWLKKLIPYDQMPLITLARRYYLSENHSPEEFCLLFSDYLSGHPDIIVELLNYYPEAGKRDLLIHLCRKTTVADNHEIALSLIADEVRSSSDSGIIRRYYENYSHEGRVLLEIANNINADSQLLNVLANIKDVRFAKKIRRASRETLAKQKNGLIQHII